MSDFLKDVIKQVGNEYASIVDDGVEAGDVDSLAMANDIQNTKYDALMAVVKQRNGNGDEPQIKLWYGKGTRQYYSNGVCLPVTYAR